LSLPPIDLCPSRHGDVVHADDVPDDVLHPAGLRIGGRASFAAQRRSVTEP
jgi:hypothetical protein